MMYLTHRCGKRRLALSRTGNERTSVLHSVHQKTEEAEAPELNICLATT